MLRFPLFLLFILYFCTSNSLSFAVAASGSIYVTLSNCLKKNSISSDEISRILYSPTNASYPYVLEAYIRNRRFNNSSTPKPVIIVTASSTQHVQATVLCTKNMGLQLKIRSGGHDFEGISYVSNVPFIILDVFNLRSIDIDTKNQTAWVQSGATLGELYYRIWEKSKLHAFPAGTCSTVGVGGHISGGGYGALMRKHGLSVDNVVDAQIVDVGGRVLDREGMGEDLFWAIRGGGGASFGVVLAYKLKLVQVPDVVTVFRVERSEELNATDIVYAWQNIAHKLDNELFIRLHLNPVSGDGYPIRISYEALFLGDSNRLMSVMGSQFPELGLKKENCLEMSWIKSALWWSGLSNKTVEALLNRVPDSVNFLKRKSDYVLTPIPKDGLVSIFNKMGQLGKTGFALSPYGGRMSEIPESDTPMPHRKGIIYKIEYLVNWQDDDPALAQKYIDQTRELYNFMTPFVSNNPRQAFLNYRDLDIGTTDNGKNSYNKGKVYGLKYFKGNFDRLVKVKTMVDPENFFRNEQSIPTLHSQYSQSFGGSIKGRK